MMHSRVHIESGDLVIVYMSRDNVIPIMITPGQILHNKYGRYLHDDLIGRKFGSKVTSAPPNPGYIHLLRPTPELWTISLPHRTQIVYSTDISFISVKLGIRPGMNVIEAGTGSGSMTHALSRSIGPRGLCHSYEYHLQRFEKAREEFTSHVLDNVRLSHRNVCKDGFGEARDVEAVFLDLPAPWDAIPHLKKVLKPDLISKVCCFSPCLEQVLKTVSTLREEGFADIYTQEVLTRNYELSVPPVATTSSMASITSTIERLRAFEVRKGERRRLQMKSAREKAQQQKAASATEKEGASIEGEHGDGQHDAEESGTLGESTKSVKRTGSMEGMVIASDGTGLGEPVHKRARLELQTSGVAPSNAGKKTTSQAEPDLVDDEESDGANVPDTGIQQPETGIDPHPSWTEPELTSPNTLLSRPYHEMRGHTSYLTFASHHPVSIIEQLELRSDGATVAVGGAKGVGATTERSVRGGGGGDDDVDATEYGSDGLDEVVGTLTEEEMIALTG